MAVPAKAFRLSRRSLIHLKSQYGAIYENLMVMRANAASEKWPGQKLLKKVFTKASLWQTGRNPCKGIQPNS